MWFSVRLSLILPLYAICIGELTSNSYESDVTKFNNESMFARVDHLIDSEISSSNIVDRTGVKVLKRTRRYLTFPEGSTFSFAFCMTVKILTPDDPDIFTEAVALATSFDLPNNTRALGLLPEKSEAVKLSRRQRSYVYSKAANILNKFGFAGEECVLRAICEGAQQLRPADNMLTEILRVILSFPDDHSGADEPSEQWVYLGAYKAGIGNYNCPDLYPSCRISFVSAIMALKPII